ncbi:MAG: hypothetical protein CSA34_01315 [Desulfobulbus propionicus]|nr:MAG: hypothetical protein CSA34_01315 [Desulfobulbus propionicus]
MKITTKVPLLASAIILVFFFTLSSIQYKVVRDAIYSTWLNNVTETSKAVSNYAAEWLDGKLAIIDMMATYISTNYSVTHLQEVMDIPLLKDQFVLIFGALEEDGKPISNTPSWNPGKDWDGRKRPWYSQARAAEQAVFTPPYNDSATGRLLISAVATIKDQKTFKGSFGGDIELQTIADVINEVDFNQKGYAFLLDKNGTIISHPDTSFNGKTISTVFAISAPTTGKEFIKTTTQDKAVLLKFTPMELKNRDTNLMIGVAIDPKKIMAETEAFKVIALVLAVLGSLITSLALYLALNHLLLKPLVELTKSADEISLGKLDVNIDGTERNDEIGLMAKAIQRLGVSINFAIEKLKKRETTPKES